MVIFRRVTLVGSIPGVSTPFGILTAAIPALAGGPGSLWWGWGRHSADGPACGASHRGSGGHPGVPHSKRWEEIVSEIVRDSSASHRECSRMADACKDSSRAGVGCISAGFSSDFYQSEPLRDFLHLLLKNTVKLETCLNALTCGAYVFALLGAPSPQVSFV